MLELYQEEVKFDGLGLFVFANPNLQMANVENTYELTGKVSKYLGTPDIAVLGFIPATDNVFALKLTVKGAEDSAIVHLSADSVIKDFTKVDFDGPDYVYLVLDGNTTWYSIMVKASENAEPVEIIINNQASIEV